MDRREHKMWPPSYIRLARRLSEVAVHEREPLEFALVVARGDFVSKHLEKITPLRADGAGLRIFDAVSGTIQDTGLKELVSLIRGNYRFFQGKDRLLLCTPSGEVLFLGRTLGSSSLELSRVPPKGESLASEDECYILHTRADLSVEVFQAGVLKLLFKSGIGSSRIATGTNSKRVRRRVRRTSRRREGHTIRLSSVGLPRLGGVRAVKSDVFEQHRATAGRCQPTPRASASHARESGSQGGCSPRPGAVT